MPLNAQINPACRVAVGLYDEMLSIHIFIFFLDSHDYLLGHSLKLRDGDTCSDDPIWHCHLQSYRIPTEFAIGSPKAFLKFKNN